MGAPVLTILKDGKSIKSCPIEGEALLGRSEGCVIRLEDRAISRQHAAFRAVDGGVQVEKRSEFAPVLVNGADCSRAIVREGDVIEIGPYLLRVSGGEEEKPEPEPAPSEAPPADAPSPDSSAAAESVASPIGLEEAPSPAQALEPFETPKGEEQPALSSQEGGFDSPLPGSESDAIIPGFSESEAPGQMPDALAIGDPMPDPLAEQPVEAADGDASTKIASLENLVVKLVFEPGQANHLEYELKDEEISIGRGKSCDIVLNDKRASRKNSVVRRLGSGYVIQDLGAANGTWVNGNRVEQQQELSGGDRIRIGDTEFEFRAISADYFAKEDQFMAVPQEEVSSEAAPMDPPLDIAAAMGAMQFPQQAPSPMPQGPGIPGAAPGDAGVAGIAGIAGIGGVKGAGVQGRKPGGFMERFRQLNKRQQYLVIIAVILFLDWFLEEEPQPPKKNPGVSSKVGATGPSGIKGLQTFEMLSPEQRRFVEAQHELAFNHYRNQDYDKTLFELSKLFSLVHDYKDAREIERYAKEGKRKLEAIEEEKRRKEEEARLKAKIVQLEDEARSLMTKKKYDAAREVFVQILALDPENAEVQRWRSELEEVEEARRLEEQRLQVQKEVNQQAWNVFREGIALKKRGKFHAAIAVFDQIREMGASDRRVLKRALREISRCKAAIDAKRNPLLKEAREAEQQGDFAKAYQLFQKATVVDPRHPEGHQGMNRIRGILHERAKVLYTEAVLAESYSDFSTAKKKYSEIMSTAPKDDLYYERAMRKLARYFKQQEEPQP